MDFYFSFEARFQKLKEKNSMENNQLPEWHPDFLKATILAEKVSIQQSLIALYKKSLQNTEASERTLQHRSFEENELALIESSLKLKWVFKRNYFLNLSNYGLMVNVLITNDEGKSAKQVMPFSSYVKIVEKRGYEYDSVKWWPAPFNSHEDFNGFVTSKLEEEGITQSNQTELVNH